MEGPPWYNGLALVVGGSSAGVLLALVTIASSGRGFYFALVTSGAGLFIGCFSVSDSI